MKNIITILFLSIFTLKAFPQHAKDSVLVRKKFLPLIATTGAVYTGGLIGLNELWYKESRRTSFHFFNDNHEWLQVDKVGHFYTAYYESKAFIQLFQWTGLSKKQALWGALAGIVFQTPIEIFDGFSPEYGASWGDLIANTTGSGLVLGQYLLWDEIRITPKFSFHFSPYASLRPNTLGQNFQERLLKDYNGQTYWLSFNLKSFLKNSKLPSWLNLSAGYGGEEMVFGDPKANRDNGYHSYRQYYLALDVDFEKIPTQKKWVRTILFGLNMIHIPSPALEFNRKGIKVHPVYF
ncbi:MAG TPA: DUF2279 domain-containing protein [Cytophagaceae bacterium]